MLYEYYEGDMVYGTMPVYVNGEATNPFTPILDLMEKHNIKTLAFRIKSVDIR